MSRRRRDLSLYKKLVVLKQYRALPKCSQRAAAELLDISRGSLRNILRDEAALLCDASTLEGSNRKRKRHGNHRDVEEALLTWYQYAQSHDISLSGPVLMQKAEEIAKNLGHDKFVASDGWFYRWKKRNHLSFHKLKPEVCEVNTKSTVEWSSKFMQDLLKKYEAANIYNADETVLYFRALPDSTSSEQVRAAKDQLTVLVCCSITGEKRHLLVVGLTRNPSCFKGVQTFPTDYVASKHAYITTKIWSDWLHTWDEKLKLQERKIALLLDNSAACGDIEGLSCIEVVKLPLNIAPLIQPCDTGVIPTLKAHYRNEMRARIIDIIEDTLEDSANAVAGNFSILDAMYMLAGSWLKVKSEKICDFWKKLGLDLAPVEQEQEKATTSLEGISENLFEECVTTEVCANLFAQLAFEEEEAKILQRSASKNCDIDDADDQEKGNDEDNKLAEEETPSATEMRLCLHRLQVGLERSGFQKMQEFGKLDGDVRQFLRNQSINNLISTYLPGN